MRWGGGNRVREWQAVRALQNLGMSKDATHLDVARELARTCVQMYARTPTGLAPEITHFPLSGLAKRKGGGGMGLVAVGGGVSVFGDVLVKDKDSHNLLRPETVESLWVLWRVTGESEWRDAGWRMWQAWERHARVDDGGYASLKSVTKAAAAAAGGANGGHSRGDGAGGAGAVGDGVRVSSITIHPTAMNNPAPRLNSTTLFQSLLSPLIYLTERVNVK